VTVRSESAEGTRGIAAALAALARRGDVVVLAGTLGAGKTTFAQGFARGLGVEGPVTSPTFTLVRQYPCRLGLLVHADVYRLEHLAEVADLGLPQLADDGVALVEWGDAAVPALGPVTWTVTLTVPPGAPGGADVTPEPPATQRVPHGAVPAEGDELRDISVRGEDDDDRRDALAVALGGVVPAR